MVLLCSITTSLASMASWDINTPALDGPTPVNQLHAGLGPVSDTLVTARSLP